MFADNQGLSVPTLALAWTLSHPAVQVAIIGLHPRRPRGRHGRRRRCPLTEGNRAAIDRILADASPVHGPSPEGM
jgi:aryl-alcohol dehydrogenase-like predicted oxidoreductase